MQKQFMVEIDLADIAAIQNKDLNIQKEQIERLLNQGLIDSYAQSQNHQKIWITLQLDYEFQVLNLLQTMHLSDFMIPSILSLSFSKSNQVFSSSVLN